MGLSNAERQQRYRDRRKEQQPRVHYRRPQDRRSRPQRWRDAVQTLVALQAEYQDWLESLPESLQGSAVAEKLEAICEYDLGTWKNWSHRSALGVIDEGERTATACNSNSEANEREDRLRGVGGDGHCIGRAVLERQHGLQSRA